MPQIDWSKVAQSVGIEGNSGSGVKAREAIALLLGKEAIHEAVDYYIGGGSGSELARHVLWQLHPWEGMTYCRQLALTDASEERRVSAVELLRVVADERALEWIPEFLASKDTGVQFWGFLIVDQLLQSGFIEFSDAANLIKSGESHPNIQVREKALEFSKWQDRSR